MVRPIPAAARSGPPYVTLGVAGLTAVTSIVGLISEPVLLALRRDPAAIGDGQV